MASVETEKQNVRALLQRNDLRNALPLLLKLSREKSRDAEIWFWLGLVQINMAHQQEAVSSFDKAVGLLPNAVEMRYQIANTLAQAGLLEESLKQYETLVTLQPGLAEAWNDLGNIYRMQMKLDNAERCLRRAVDTRPDLVSGHYNLGLVFISAGRVDEAIKSYQQALALDPSLVQAHIGLGSAYSMKGELDYSIASFQRAIQLDGRIADAHANLAITLEKLHRLDEARETVMQALALDSGHFSANVLLVQLDARQGNGQAGLESIDRLLQAPLQEGQRAIVFMEQAKLLDKLDRYQEAFQSYEQAKSCWKTALPIDNLNHNAYLERIARNRAWFSRQRIEHARQYYQGESQDISIGFLVGFPRSGTTLTEQILEAHPGLVATHERATLSDFGNNLSEILERKAAYPEDLHSLSGEEWKRLRKEYWRRMDDIVSQHKDKKVLLDKLPLNIVDLGFARMLFPEARILVALRDPRDVCLSCYKQSFQLNQAMVHFLSLDGTTRLYEEVMGLWLKYREEIKSDVLEIRYEDTVADLESNARTMLTFFGLDWNPGVLRYHESAATRYANTPSYQNVTKPIYRGAIGSWAKYQEQLQPFMERLQPFLSEFGYQ